MRDSFSLEREDLSELGRILENYLSDSHASRMDKLQSEFGCFGNDSSNTLEDVCYFAALDIDNSGRISELKKFLENEREIRLADDCETIIQKYIEKEIEPTVNPKEFIPPKKLTHSIEELKQKLQYSLRQVLKNYPKKEFDIHDAIEQLLAGTEFDGKYIRDVEAIPFSETSAKPDFTFNEIQTAVEVKFCKEKKCIKKILKEMMADIPPYKKQYKNIIFVVYDMGQIQNEDNFKKDFESIENITVVIVKQ